MIVTLLMPSGVSADELISTVDGSESPSAQLVRQPDVNALTVPATNDASPQVDMIPGTLEKPLNTTPAALPGPQPTEAIVSPPATVMPQPLVIPTSEPLLVSSFKITPSYGFDFVELHNTTDAMVSVQNMTIQLLYSTNPGQDYECQIKLHGYMRPLSYVTYSTRDGIDGAYGVSGCPIPGAQLYDKEIQITRDGIPIESVRIAATDMSEVSAKQWERGGWTATYRSGSFTKDFKSPAIARGAYTSALYEAPSTPALQFLEIFPRPLACSIGDPGPTCHPYVKVKNISSDPIDLTQFRLRNGSINAASSKYNTSTLSGTIQPGEFAVITKTADGNPLAINDSDGATWLEDVYGLATYSNTDTPYQDADLVAQMGKSWAYDSVESVWKWAIPAPYSADNSFVTPGMGDIMPLATSTLKPCADNQYRSLETNRCRLIETLSSTLMPCKDGQYRSEETNRCRSIAMAAAAVLKPCQDDQFRNPATGRCKKIASTDDLPQPCPAGKERNPATNRCRNVVSTDLPTTAFAVEPLKQGAKSFVGWWALGGVGAVAAGYATWEWRRELKQVIQKVASFVHSRG